VKTDFSFKNGWGKYNTTAYYERSFVKAPVVLFLHGLGATKDMYTWLIRTLSAEGFVVVMLNVPRGWFNTFELLFKMLFWNGSKFLGRENHPFENIGLPALEIWSDGMISCISSIEETNIFADKIDLERIFCMGHSAGGLGSLLAAGEDDRIKKVVALAPPLLEEEALPYPKSDLNIPVQIQCGTKDSLFEGDQKFYNMLKAPKKEFIKINGGDHIQYIDSRVVKAAKMATKLMNIPFIGTLSNISTEKQHQISKTAFIKWFKDK
jgi:pimeloyl-ACP methyl ester carboxylesterase